MSTRAQVRFATREDGVSFSEHPEKINAQFYVHSDGYPEFLGIEIANSIQMNYTVDNLEIEYLDDKHGDLEYIYYIWQSLGKETWISIFKTTPVTDEDDDLNFLQGDECIFVGEPQKLIEKYD